MTIEGGAFWQVAIKTLEGMDGIDGIVVIVHQDAHAWIVARHCLVGIFKIGSMVAVIGLAIKDVFLEVPAAQFLEGAVVFGGFKAVIEQFAIVIDLHNEGLVDKREVEVAWYLALAFRRVGGRTFRIGVDADAVRLIACGVFYLVLAV